jgi:hypothetical protein
MRSDFNYCHRAVAVRCIAWLGLWVVEPPQPVTPPHGIHQVATVTEEQCSAKRVSRNEQCDQRNDDKRIRNEREKADTKIAPTEEKIHSRGRSQPLFCEVFQGSLNCDFLRLTTGGRYLYFVFASLSSARP